MNAPIEAKVRAASSAAAVTSFVLWLLGTYAFGGDVPEPVAGVVLFLVPGLVTFMAGWAAWHTHRPDLEEDISSGEAPPPPA